MISIHKNEVKIDETQLEKLRNSFEQKHSFVIPQFFAPELQPVIDAQLSKAEYSLNYHKGNQTGKIFASEYTVKQSCFVGKILSFYLNHIKVKEAVKRITEMRDIAAFDGRVYKFEADENSFDDWHSDIRKGRGHRLVGISLNLSSKPYEGGKFIIRNSQTHEIYNEIRHSNWGGVHFFRIGNKLEHKVEKVTGTHPRIAYAGWFLNRKTKAETDK